jgi:DNA topoisomerase-3
MAYVCEKSVGAVRSCDFRSGKVILQQEIARAEMARLLESGKTNLLKGFVSNRTRKKFSAYLVRGADGKVGFEFEARTPRASKAAKAAPGAKTTTAAVSEPNSAAPVKVSRGTTPKPAKRASKPAATKKSATKKA